MNRNDKIIQDTKSPLNRVSLDYLPHSFTACPNLTVEYTNNRTNGRFYNSNPVPIFLPKIDTLAPDIFLKPVLEKDKWISNINCLRKKYKRSTNIIKLEDYQNVIENEKIIPQYLADFYNYLNDDPDIYFNGNYNWYHTNGSLDVQDCGNEKFLFHVTGPIQNNLNISKLVYNNKMNVLNVKTVYTKNTDNTIFETGTGNINNDLYVYNRYKFKFTINNFQYSNNKSTLNCIYRKTSALPLTSACVNFSKNTYCLVNVNQKINIYDINSDQCTSIILENVNKIDRWSNILYSNESQLVYVNRENIFLIDTRDSKNIHEKFTIPNNLLRSCDYNSFVQPCLTQENQYFIGTYHSVYLIDIRNNKNVIRRWTHMMNSVPFIGKLNNINNLETICISSPVPNEKVLFKNCDNSAPPIILNSLYDTRKQLQFKSSCLHPKSSINTRINYSTTGLTLVNINNKSYILSQNALGDIYAQEYSTRDTRNDNFIPHDFKRQFEQKFTSNKPLKLTHEISMKHLLAKNRNLLQPVEKTCRKSKRKKDTNSWCRNINELKQYKDLLAQTTLFQWGYVDDADVNGIDKVTSWLLNVNTETDVEHMQTQEQEIDQETELTFSQLEQSIKQSENVYTSTQQTTDMFISSGNVSKSDRLEKHRYVSGF